MGAHHSTRQSGFYDEPERRPASIYDAPAAERVRAAAAVGRRRRLVKPIGITAALAAVAAGVAVYMAVGQAAAAPNMDCTLIVPPNPLSAQGLATPYRLVATNPRNGPCNEANPNQSAFVQGAIISPAGQISLYDPLVVDQGTQPLAPPAAASVPAGSTVALWFGFNGANLTLRSAPRTFGVLQGRCVNGLFRSIFGQFAYCNAPAFFQAANAAIRAGTLRVPALGTARDGKPCPTVRDFSVVDQDQSDNVVTHYLANANGRTGQPNNATRMALQNAGATDLANGSDNRLLDVFVSPTLGCTPWTAPNQSADGQATPSLPLNELQAAAGQQAPVARVPLTDPMAMIDNVTSAFKTNLFRAGVDQAPVSAADNGNGTTYCQNLFVNPAGIQRVFNAMVILQNGASPDPAAASNLFTFLAMRGNQTFTNLNCQNLLKMANPITLTMTNNMVTAATFTAGGATGGMAGGGTPPAPSASASAVAGGGGTGGSPAPSMAAPSTSMAAPSPSMAAPSPTNTGYGSPWWWRHHH